jgi:hypothetical protein
VSTCAFFLVVPVNARWKIGNLEALVMAHLHLVFSEQLQQFVKPTWHPYNFGKTRKIGLQQFGKPTCQK